MLVPPQDDPRDEPPPVFFGEEIDVEGGALVYVLDCSGSMSLGAPVTRFEKAQRELRRSIAGLPPTLKFNVVDYDCAIMSMWPAARAATPEAKALADAYVAALVPRGGTGTAPAVIRAFADPAGSTVVLLTDGCPTCGVSGSGGGKSGWGQGCHRTAIRNANHRRATVNVFGIETGGVTREFCQAVAADSSGSYFDVP